mmetsp:Transcript_24612/g.36488  ORF Transcript_24612/g.36488 Transcript_24612/m.36488 type:complete len:287 (+) Transcript_24612:2175-3035(+)
MGGKAVEAVEADLFIPSFTNGESTMALPKVPKVKADTFGVSLCGCTIDAAVSTRLISSFLITEGVSIIPSLPTLPFLECFVEGKVEGGAVLTRLNSLSGDVKSPLFRLRNPFDNQFPIVGVCSIVLFNVLFKSPSIKKSSSSPEEVSRSQFLGRFGFEFSLYVKLGLVFVASGRNFGTEERGLPSLPFLPKLLRIFFFFSFGCCCGGSGSDDDGSPPGGGDFALSQKEFKSSKPVSGSVGTEPNGLICTPVRLPRTRISFLLLLEKEEEEKLSAVVFRRFIFYVAH